MSAVLSDLHQHILTVCDIAFVAIAGDQDSIAIEQDCSAETPLQLPYREGDAHGLILRGRRSKSTSYIMLEASGILCSDLAI